MLSEAMVKGWGGVGRGTGMWHLLREWEVACDRKYMGHVNGHYAVSSDGRSRECRDGIEHGQNSEMQCI